MDVHVPRPVTRGLRQLGVDVLTAQEDGTTRLEDAALLDRAGMLGRVLFSQDADLLTEAARRQRESIAFAGVIYAPQLALSIRQLIEDLELIGKAATPGDCANLVQYLPLH
jgi:predicted nuclease of predicted toxin-antitoxin system